MIQPSAEPNRSVKERAGNFWYYHRWHLLAALAVLLAGVLTVLDLRKDPPADCSVGLVIRSDLPAGTEETVRKAFESVLEDRSGDGRVSVDLNVYRIAYDSSVRPADQISGVTRLTADLQTNSCFLFLTDGAEYFQERLELFATNAELGLPGPEDAPAGIPWSRCGPFSGTPLPPGAPDLTLVLRWADPESLRPGRLESYTQARDLFSRLTGTSPLP